MSKDFKYEIWIGEEKKYDPETRLHLIHPKRVFTITEDQKLLIETFANKILDADLVEFYQLNDCKFRIFTIEQAETIRKCKPYSNER